MASAVLTKPTTTARAAAESHRDPEPDADRADDFSMPAAFLGLPRGQILSTVAHEIRGPVTSLLASAEILHEDFDVLPDEQKREIVSSMHRGTLWLHTLVENLLCEAALHEGRLQMHRQPAEISDIVAEVEPIVTPLLDRNQQRLDLFFDDAPHIVNVDSRRIGQVLVNLLTNAAKYGRAGAPVELAVSRRAESVVVAVADHARPTSAASSSHTSEPAATRAPISPARAWAWPL
jgi:K+-sensing histidine kinase KdpD